MRDAARGCPPPVTTETHMDTIYIVIIIALFLLAVFDLNNGVANDAVNFLNSAIGSKVAPVRVILTVASIGVLIGSIFSSGMMEIARSGIFVPGSFTFHEVMFLFLGVMIAEVLLLDTFNTFGLPTSTTVSIVFGLMGAGVASAFYRISTMPKGSDSSTKILEYINTDKSFEIVLGILLSVAIAFTVGMVVMWISRFIFSFRYQRSFKIVGSLWCGIAMTAICYFAMFKGLTSTSLIDRELLSWVEHNMLTALVVSFGGFSVLMVILQHLFMVNILRLTVLAGTFSLALAFAGNDLVNFIGVFVAALDSCGMASDFVSAGGDLSNYYMGGLEGPAPANPLILGGAGIIMVLALWFSKKAKTVIETGVELSRQGDGGVERFGSVPPARATVRAAIALGSVIKLLVPPRMLVKMNRRWNPIPLPSNPKDRLPFDLIRATVNLTVASLLIAWATSYKLPLSTTYVTFMVAMGSSLADKAWGRESAVYRVTGVFTVISGWFMTGLAAFTLASILTLILQYGEIWSVGVLLPFTAIVLIRSRIWHRKREEKFSKEHFEQLTEENIMQVCTAEITDSVTRITEIYTQTVDSLIMGNRKTLKDLASEAVELSSKKQEMYQYDILPFLYKMQTRSLDTGYHFVQALNHLNEASSSLEQFTQSIYTYVDNNHAPFTIEQIADLKEIHEEMVKLLKTLCLMLKTGNYSNFEYTLVMQEQLFQLIARATKRQIKRAQRNQTRTRSSLLYLNMLTEIRFMALQMRALTSDERNFITA